MIAGFWMVQVVQRGPFVASRIWLCDHEVGVPENHMPDRPYWQGQLALDLTPPSEIWDMVWFCELPPEEQRAVANPPMSERAPRHGRSAAFTVAPLALWKQTRARKITEAEFAKQVAWLQWAVRNDPQHQDANFRKPIDLSQVEIPRFI